MKINLAKSAGFCFGVERALSIAKDSVKDGKKVYMLGDIVHNEDVVGEIKNIGIEKLKELAKNNNNTLLIRAHGAPKKIIDKAKRYGYDIVDATCPMVKEIHKIAKDSEKKGYRLIIIGDKQHDEVRGIAGQLKTKALIIDSIESISPDILKPIEKAAIVVQSTQDIERVKKIIAKLKKSIKEVRFFNTICKPTTTKQQEIKKMPLENDIMLIVGSKSSANTKRLYQISRSLNKNTFWIQSKNDLKPKWFQGINSVGITSGASTPEKTTKDIVKYLQKLSS